MNVYFVEGKVEYTAIKICRECGQDYEREMTDKASVEVEAASPEEAVAESLNTVTRILEEKYRSSGGVDNVEWKKEPRVELVRELSEAERMQRLGAPALF